MHRQARFAVSLGGVSIFLEDPLTISRVAAALAASALGFASLGVRAEVPAPKDVPYPGTLKIHVDATDVAHRVFRVQETLPAKPGPLTLLYPRWLPGTHSPSGPISKLAGLVVTAGGRALPWRRDPLDVYAFHVDVPRGATSVAVAFEYLSPQNPGEGRVVMTPEMLNLQWNANTLYPAGYYASRIPTQASVTFPAGWQFGTALEEASHEGGTVTFQPIGYNDLVDSPIYAGRYFKRLDLDPGAKAPVYLDLVADAPEDLAITPDQLEAHRALVQQMDKLYGARHFDHYDFLLSLSSKMGRNGLEHHRSSEDGVGPDYFTAWNQNAMARSLLPHEFNHSWDGKYRRPADLWTPNFNVPMQDSLLWVYEGQTMFWGFVLPARSGLWTDEQARDFLAMTAATYDKGRPGLASWRTVQDTTNDPIIAQRAPLPYRNYQASEDYYSAGLLIWLDVDAQLRALSHGTRSIDDFAKAFFGGHDGVWAASTYTFEDVVNALNGIEPFGWAAYLRDRLDGHGPWIDGFAAHGWKLVYTGEPSAAAKAMGAARHGVDLTYSLGLTVNQTGGLVDVLWDGPAFKAGLAPGMALIAVNGHAYTEAALKAAVTAAAKDPHAPIDLLVRNFDEFQTLRIAYHEGLRYPHLVRDPSRPDTLTDLLRAR